MAYTCEHTKYGFRWGPLMVSRLCSDHRGGLLLQVQTKEQAIEIRVSPKGRHMEIRDVKALDWLWKEEVKP